MSLYRSRDRKEYGVNMLRSNLHSSFALCSADVSGEQYMFRLIILLSLTAYFCVCV